MPPDAGRDSQDSEVASGTENHARASALDSHEYTIGAEPPDAASVLYRITEVVSWTVS